jgi:hypothetical protein
MVAAAYRALQAQENQAAGANPLGPALSKLTRRLECLTAERLASEKSASPGTSGGSGPAVSALVMRIRYVRSLLVKLARIDPSYAARLLREARALDLLLDDLLGGPTAVQLPPNSAPSGETELGAVGRFTVPDHPRVTVERAAATGYISIVGTPHDVDDAPSAVGASEATNSSAHRHTSSAPAEESAQLLTTLTVSTGPSRSMSAAGTSTGAAAGALAMMCTVGRGPGMSSGRLKLAALPWQLAVLGHRLERPG